MTPFIQCKKIYPGIGFYQYKDKGQYWYEIVPYTDKKPHSKPAKQAEPTKPIKPVKPVKPKAKKKAKYKPTAWDDFLTFMIFNIGLIISPLILAIIFGNSFLKWFY